MRLILHDSHHWGNEDEEYSYSFVAEDPDGDSLIYTVPPKTIRLEFILWQDNLGNASNRTRYHDITLGYDGAINRTIIFNSCKKFMIHCYYSNPIVVKMKIIICLCADAEDDDGDSLSFSAKTKPSWLSFDSITILYSIPIDRDIDTPYSFKCKGWHLPQHIRNFQLIVLNLMIRCDYSNPIVGTMKIIYIPWMIAEDYDGGFIYPFIQNELHG